MLVSRLVSSGARESFVLNHKEVSSCDSSRRGCPSVVSKGSRGDESILFKVEVTRRWQRAIFDLI